MDQKTLVERAERYLIEDDEYKEQIIDNKIVQNVVKSIFGFDDENVDKRNFEKYCSDLEGKIVYEDEDGFRIKEYTGLISKEYIEKYFGMLDNLPRLGKEFGDYEYNDPGQSYSQRTVIFDDNDENTLKFNISIRSGLDI